MHITFCSCFKLNNYRTFDTKFIINRYYSIIKISKACSHNFVFYNSLFEFYIIMKIVSITEIYTLYSGFNNDIKMFANKHCHFKYSFQI